MSFLRNRGNSKDSNSLALFVTVAVIIIFNSVAKANPNPLYGISASVDAANDIDRQRQGTSSNLANSNKRAPPIRSPVINTQQSVDLRPPVRRNQHGSGTSNIRSTPRPSPYPQRWFIEYFLPENWQFWRWRKSINKDATKRKSKEHPYQQRHQQPPLETKWRRKPQNQYNPNKLF